MKKILVLMIALFTVFTLSACGTEDSPEVTGLSLIGGEMLTKAVATPAAISITNGVNFVDAGEYVWLEIEFEHYDYAITSVTVNDQLYKAADGVCNNGTVITTVGEACDDDSEMRFVTNTVTGDFTIILIPIYTVSSTTYNFNSYNYLVEGNQETGVVPVIYNALPVEVR